MFSTVEGLLEHLSAALRDNACQPLSDEETTKIKEQFAKILLPSRERDPEVLSRPLKSDLKRAVEFIPEEKRNILQTAIDTIETDFYQEGGVLFARDLDLIWFHLQFGDRRPPTQPKDVARSFFHSGSSESDPSGDNR